MSDDVAMEAKDLLTDRRVIEISKTGANVHVYVRHSIKKSKEYLTNLGLFIKASTSGASTATTHDLAFPDEGYTCAVLHIKCSYTSDAGTVYSLVQAYLKIIFGERYVG